MHILTLRSPPVEHWTSAPIMAYTVELYVYDISMGMAKQFSMQLLGRQFEGIWHTGIVVYNKEYFYGGGICCLAPGQTPFGVPVKRIPLGTTDVASDVFEEFLSQISDRFSMATYNLLTHNCNHFTDECAMFLMGSSIPDYIKNLPQDFLTTPFGAMIAPMINNVYSRVNSEVPHPDWHHPQTAAAAPVAPAAAAPPPASAPAPQQLPFGTHPHRSIAVQIIGYSQPVLFESGDVKAIMGKLNSFLAELPSEQKLSEEHSVALGTVGELLAKRDKTQSVPPTVVPLFDHLLRVLPLDKLFPALDLLRLLIVFPDMAAKYTTPDDGVVPPLLKKHIVEGSGVPKAVQIMLLRLAANLFATPVEVTVGAACAGLLLADPSPRMGAAALAYNLSLYLVGDESDAAVSLVSALAQALNAELQKSDDEAAFTMLMALGHFLFCNDMGVDLVKAMDLSLQRYLASAVDKIRLAATDVSKLLSSRPSS